MARISLRDDMTIYVIGYPKSGTTWLARLLGDALNSPVGALRPEDDGKAIATEGQERTGNYYIRQGHATPVTGVDSVMPTQKDFGYECLTDEKVIVMWRDPRDILVSAAHHWNRSLDEMLNCMVNGDWPLTHGGGWVNWCRSWLDGDCPVSFEISYECLRTNTDTALKVIIHRLGISEPSNLQDVIHRQSFESRKAWTENYGDNLNYGKQFQLRFLRKGIVGDWKSSLQSRHLSTIKYRFGSVMRELRYV